MGEVGRSSHLALVGEAAASAGTRRSGALRHWLAAGITDARAGGALTALAVLLASVTWRTWGDLGADTGYDLVAGSAVAHGLLPYADFTYYYGPLAPALAGLFSLVGGGGLGPAIALGITLACVVIALTYAYARVYVGPAGSLLAAAIVAPVVFAPNNLSYVLPYTYSAPLAVAATLGFLLALAHHAGSGNGRLLGVAGACAGLVTLTRPEFVLAVAAAAIAWLALGSRRQGFRRAALLLLGPAAAIPALVYGAFLFAVSPGVLLFDNLYPVEELQAAGSALLRTHAPLTAASFVELGARLVLYAAGVAGLLVAARLLGGRHRRPMLALLLVGGAAAIAGSLARPETLRWGLEFVYGWIPAGAAIAVVVVLVRARRGSSMWASAEGRAALAGLIVLAVLAVKTYAAFYVHAPNPQYAVFALPFAAVFLVRLHLRDLAPRRAAAVLGACWLAFLAVAGVGLTVKDSRAESELVRGAGGTLAAAPADAAEYRAAVRWIETRTRAGEPILLAPQLTSLYTLTDRTDPLRQLALLPGALPRVTDERDAIAQLEDAGVRLAVIDRRAFPEYGHTTFGGSFDRVLDEWLHAQFARVDTTRTGTRRLELWMRRGA